MHNATDITKYRKISAQIIGAHGMGALEHVIAQDLQYNIGFVVLLLESIHYSLI